MGKLHLPAIDGLRAIAVLAVVAYHAGLPLAAGYVGVDVFFVISGYVITRMLAAEPTIDLAAFYARRVRRILPALVLVVAATLAASTAVLGTDPQVAVTRSAIAAMAMAANLYFQAVTGGYWDAGVDDLPLLHLWSLGVEEQFYLVWPLLLIACRRRAWVIAVLAAASLAAAHHWMAVDREAAFYQMPLRFWELAAGGLVALLPATRLGPITATLGLAATGYALANGAEAFPGMGAALPVFGTALVLHAIHGGTKIHVLELAPVRYVGLVSYSLYLWHWPLLALHRASTLEPPPLQDNLALCAVAFALAALTYHWVELPFRRSNAPKVRAIALGVATCVALAGCAAAVGAHAPRDAFAAQVAQDFPVVPAACHGQLEDAPRLPAPACGTGPVVLWGDSHAYAWRPYAETLGAITPLTRAGCPPLAGNRDQACNQYVGLATERAGRGRVVVLAARWHLYGDVATLEARLDATLGALQDVSRVVVLAPLPEMPYAPAKCMARRRIDLCTVPRAEFEHAAAPIRAALRAAIARHPNAEYVETAEHFCTADACPMTKAGRSLYWDADHITASAARGFAGDD